MLRRVEVAEAVSAERTVTLVSPTGIRVEGVTISEVITILRGAGVILGTSRAVSVFAYPAPVDLRNGYNGLYGLVQTGLQRDPLSGELYLFVKQSRKLCKVLLWDGTGLCSASTTSCAAERSPPSQARSCHRSIRILPSSPTA